MPGSNNRENQKIFTDRPRLILCEGADAYYFLIWLLDFLKSDSEIFNEFWVYNFGGMGDLKPYLGIIANSDNFNAVKSIIVIRDAEKDAAGACQSVQSALRQSGFAVPPESYSLKRDEECKYPRVSTGFILFPDCNSTPGPGTLEDLCLRILSGEGADAILADADQAIKPYVETLPRLHKNRLHTYFSLTNEFVSLKIGEAAKAKAFSYDGPEIKSLMSFLMLFCVFSSLE